MILTFARRIFFVVGLTVFEGILGHCRGGRKVAQNSAFFELGECRAEIFESFATSCEHRVDTEVTGFG